jgi:hypothetical protein
MDGVSKRQTGFDDSSSVARFQFQTEELLYQNYQLPKDIMKHGNPGEYLSRQEIRQSAEFGKVSTPGYLNSHTFMSKPASRWRFCVKCQVYKLPRMHHCSVCNRCCVKYDHHCAMALNCIGINNFHLFVTFLSSTIFVRIIYKMTCGVVRAI